MPVRPRRKLKSSQKRTSLHLKNRRARVRTSLLEHLEDRRMLAVNFSEFLDPNPNPGNDFGTHVVPLSTGNVVITSPYDDAGGTDAGAVYLFNGQTGSLISTLTGSADDDRVGNFGVTPLTNGNYVVRSPYWSGNGFLILGAVTWGNGNTGISGVVSANNSLVGSTIYDHVGLNGVTALTNGNYVVASRYWNSNVSSDAGAVTWGSGTTGISGTIDANNSLIGSNPNDIVGEYEVTALTNGNYVVRSPYWDNNGVSDAGAVTWGSGLTGATGEIDANNSLVGSTTSDQVGNIDITALTNGNYVVASSNWDNNGVVNAGAVTWGSGVMGISGTVNANDSLVGSSAGDQIGSNGVSALTNGNYVIASNRWDNNGSGDVGAVTWGNGITGIVGVVNINNSLIGSTTNDNVGNFGVTTLTGGNYVVVSPNWDNNGFTSVGAVTWGSGATGITGEVSDINSLVGSNSSDAVGDYGVTALTNGNYVVASPNWDKNGAGNAGAVTWANGNTGISGVVSAINSLVGSSTSDAVGFSGVTALTNGNYVVASSYWGFSNAGAVTWGNGTTGITGTIDANNSLVGSKNSDSVGSSGVAALTNGNYVVRSDEWDNNGVSNAGAVT